MFMPSASPLVGGGGLGSQGLPFLATLSPLFTWRSAICESDLPSTTRHVALTLSLHMNERGDSCFPSVKTLARETGLDRRTVQRRLRELADADWLSIETSGGIVATPGGKQPTNRFRAMFPKGAAEDRPHEQRGRQKVTKGAALVHKGGGTGPPKDDIEDDSKNGGRKRISEPERMRALLTDQAPEVAERLRGAMHRE